MIASVTEFLAARSARERRLAVVAVVSAGAAIVTVAGDAVHRDLTTLRARIAAHERELQDVRRLAHALRATGGDTDTALPARLEQVAHGVVHEATVTADGAERALVRVSGATFPATVRLLHALEAARPRVVLERVELHRGTGGLDATISASTTGGSP